MDPKVHYHAHKSPPPVLTVNETHPVHNFSLPYSNISSHLRLGLVSGLFNSGLTTKILYASLISHMRAKCPFHQILIDLITLYHFTEISIRGHDGDRPGRATEVQFSAWTTTSRQTATYLMDVGERLSRGENHWESEDEHSAPSSVEV